jgi:hypothetical protein
MPLIEAMDTGEQKQAYLFRIKGLEKEFNDAQFLKQRKTLQASLVSARQDYFNFLKDSGLMQEATNYLNQHPEIENPQATAS